MVGLKEKAKKKKGTLKSKKGQPKQRKKKAVVEAEKGRKVLKQKEREG